MSESISTVITFLPLIVLIWLANLADARPRTDPRASLLARLTYGILVLLYAGIVLAGLLLAGSERLSTRFDLSFLVERYRQAGVEADLVQRIADSLPVIGLGLIAAALAALLLLLPPVRRILARIIPIDPTRVVHAVALSFTMLIVMNMVMALGIGLGVLTELILVRAAELDEMTLTPSMLAGVWVQQIVLAFWALIGVGWLSRRSLMRALDRLGIVWPDLRQIVVGMGGGFSAVFITAVLSGLAASLDFGIDPDVQSLNEILLGPLFRSWPGVLTVGLAAALGEETLFRGALQPRFGPWLTTLLFAITHSNYGLSLSTVVVFAAGLLFALLRRRYTTTTSMIAHATYNTSLGLMALLAAKVIENSAL